jgi:DNA-binding MarR family transcriptional regulator
MFLPGNARCRLSDSVRLAVRGEFGILLDVKRGKFYSLTPTGTAICLCLKNEVSGRSLLSTLTHKYDVSPELLRNDIERFLSDLRSRRLCIVEE